MSQSAIDVAGLGKRYEIYDRPHQRLFQTILRGRRTFYREFWALSDVTLSVQRGETVGLVGRNGSGKSTLLQLVAGTLTPTTGIVRTHGRIAALLELGSGFNPEFTGRENVYLNGAILGISRREMNEAIPAIEAFADIGDFIDQPVKTYSSGMLVRLAFAVAVHVTPDILLIDEALAVGDTAFQSKCLARIRDMQQGGVAILLVSHAPNTIIEFCDRAAYLDRGRLVAVGDSRDIVERYTNDLVSSFGGTTLPSAPDTGARNLPAEHQTSPASDSAAGDGPETSDRDPLGCDRGRSGRAKAGIFLRRHRMRSHRGRVPSRQPRALLWTPDQESRRHRAVDVHDPVDGSHAAAEAGGSTRDARMAVVRAVRWRTVCRRRRERATGRRVSTCPTRACITPDISTYCLSRVAASDGSSPTVRFETVSSSP